MHFGILDSIRNEKECSHFFIDFYLGIANSAPGIGKLWVIATAGLHRHRIIIQGHFINILIERYLGATIRWRNSFGAE